jgi:hypothetical protein
VNFAAASRMKDPARQRRCQPNRYPVDVTDKFIKGDGKRVYVFHEFFDLTPRANYATRDEWYDPGGQIIGSFAKKIKPTGSHWKLWAWLSLDHKWNRMSGQWSVKTLFVRTGEKRNPKRSEPDPLRKV